MVILLQHYDDGVNHPYSVQRHAVQEITYPTKLLKLSQDCTGTAPNCIVLEVSAVNDHQIISHKDHRSDTRRYERTLLVHEYPDSLIIATHQKSQRH